MKYILPRIILLTLIVSMISSIQPAIAKKSKKPAAKSEQLLTRIDFGNSYISGQSLKSGAVYMMQRKKNEMKTMLKYRENYRKEILDSHEVRKKEIKK